FDGTCLSAFAPAGSSCGDAEGACIYADACDGLGNCADGGFKPITTACGDPSDTGCDDPDHCSGTDATCVNEGSSGSPEVCDGLDNDCDGIVDDAATLTVEADRHTIGTGSHPGSVKTPLAALSVGIYSKATGSCAQTTCGGVSWQNYACIVASCEEVARQDTDINGITVFTLAAGDYLVIGSDGTDKHLGVSASDLACGDEMRKYLQEIVTANGKTHPAKTTVRTGSELLIVEPEYVEWTTPQELYPYVFDSLGDWAVMTSVTPPEGFVADYTSLTAEVISEVEAVQFTITDVGSDWVPTKVQHRVRHGARNEVVLSRIGILVGPDLALAKGLDRAGHPVGGDGQPIPSEGFDPRRQPPAELIGWIEPSAADVAWTVKYRVNEGEPVLLRVTDSQGRLVKLLATGVQPSGERSVTWDGRDISGRYLPPGDYFLTFSAGAWTESSRVLTIGQPSPLSRPNGHGGPPASDLE
ncbi:MAG TPA: FlgD immunoglobulin-like domain containing protein, partial [Candidatus Polarisedimenticolaceae bacterium]|nr:FlgD immunoglobulin-like domain containing protein [Candidatus Polarisedimenticolaceae bacterium]